MAKNINLDNLGSSPKKPKPETNQSTPSANTELGLTISTKSSAAPKVKLPEAPTSLKDVYDAHQTLAFLIDISGSMLHQVGPAKPSVADFEWGICPVVTDFVNTVEQAKKTLALYDTDRYYQAVMKLAAAALTLDVPQATLQQLIIDMQLTTTFGVPLKKGVGISRIDLVKKNAKTIIQKRIEKHPDADIRLLRFHTDAEPINARTSEQLMAALDQLQVGGGTNIMAAVETALAWFKKSPSKVGMHHIVLVTDGEDYNAVMIRDLVGTFKASGVVFDYIYISSGDSSDGSTGSEVAKVMQNVCKETGGDYVEVKTVEDFEQKFLAASTRLCLPPAAV